MDPSTVLVFLLYGAALVFIIHFMMAKSAPSSPVIIQQPDVVYSSDSWWPFPITSYNYFPWWTGYYNGGGDGGYGWRHGGWHRGGHRSSYGPIGTPASRPGGGMSGGGGHGGRGGGGRR